MARGRRPCLLLALPSCLAPLGFLFAQDRIEVDIEGEVRVFAVAGDLDRKLDEDEDRRNGLRNVADIDFILVRENEDQGWRYGGVFSLETALDGQSREQKSFAFFESDLGELRLGSDDPAAVSLRTGPSELAAGTGGLDGEIIDSGGLITPELLDGDEVRAIFYPVPVQDWHLGLSIADGEENSEWEADLAASWRPFGVEETKALSIGAGWRDEGDYALQFSGQWRLDSVKLGFSTFVERIEGETRQSSAAGLALEFSEGLVSLTGGICHRCDDGEDWNIVLGGETEILDGLKGFAELSRFDEGGKVGAIGLFGIGLEF